MHPTWSWQWKLRMFSWALTGMSVCMVSSLVIMHYLFHNAEDQTVLIVFYCSLLGGIFIGSVSALIYDTVNRNHTRKAVITEIVTIIALNVLAIGVYRFIYPAF